MGLTSSRHSLSLEVVPEVVLHLGDGVSLLVDILDPVAERHPLVSIGFRAYETSRLLLDAP